jgi:hypothetical protein
MESRRGRVLVVDDEPMVGSSIRRLLGRDHVHADFQARDPDLARRMVFLSGSAVTQRATSTSRCRTRSSRSLSTPLACARSCRGSWNVPDECAFRAFASERAQDIGGS